MFKNSRIALIAGILAICGLQVSAQQPNPDLSGLRWRFIGPMGNRLTSVVGVPGQPDVYYVGAASGGIWKTTDGGVHWEPVFDSQPVSSIGAIEVAPSNSNIVWAGTGEAWIRSHISVGQGIYKSTDAGKTWRLMGLEKTGRIGHIAIDAKNPDIVLACALGHAYGPQQERGVFRTTDGGAHWERVLFVDENCGCSDLKMDPNNSNVLFAGMWPLEIHTWGRTSGGPGSGLYTSRDGGITWKKVSGHGLPTKMTGKWALAIAPSNSDRIYALIETGDGVPVNGQETDRGKLWRSDDGGENWRVVSYDRTMGGRTHYYFRIETAPDNENEVYFLTAAFSVSIDGGQSLQTGRPFGSSPGGDNHDIWIDPTNAKRMAVANDGGVSISVNRGRTWDRIQLPIAQMYHVTVDDRIPYYVYGNEQDDPSYRGPSRTGIGGGGGGGGGIPRSLWHEVGGGESGWATPDPTDNNIIWSSASGSGSIGGIVTRMDLRTGAIRNVEVWPDQTNGNIAADVKYRFVWTFPLTISPHDHNKLYVGSQYVHTTSDGGENWQVISPDLTSNDKSKQGYSGGLTGDNIGVEYAPVIFAIAESPKQEGVIWAGTNDGIVQITRDGGKNWTNVTANIPNMLPWGTVSNIEASRYDAGTAYITVDGHQVNNREPWVYRTNDYGKSWKLITNGIPHNMLSYAHCVREDPTRRGLLYLGTEGGLFVSHDDGANWQPLQNNLPHAPVYWMVVQERFNDLVIATYGRGFWILDDLTPIQQWDSAVKDSAATLFVPRSAYRLRGMVTPFSMSDDPSVGQNPPGAVSINYYLKSAAKSDPSIKITDAQGQAVATLRGTRTAGMNRVWWNLRTDQTKEIRLRTAPEYGPDIRLNNDGWRPLPEGGRISILVPPGSYTVKLSVDGQEYSQSLTVVKDPNSGGSEADIQKQMQLLTAIRRNVENVADMVNQIESLRAQLDNLESLLKTKDLKDAAEDLDKKLMDIEDNLIQRRLTGQGQDTVRWPPKLISKLTYLANGLASSDFAPTTQQGDVQAMFESQVSTQLKRLHSVVQIDLPNFNQMLREKNIGNVIAGGQ